VGGIYYPGMGAEGVGGAVEEEVAETGVGVVGETGDPSWLVPSSRFPGGVRV